MLVVLITGASGMLGKEVLNRLVNKSEYLVFTCKHTEPFPDIEPDYIVHCAAISSQAYNENNPYEVFEANVNYTQRLIEKYKSEYKPPTIIFPSSIAVYGGDRYHKYIETDIPKPKTLYGISKLSAEKILKYYHSMGVIKAAIFRLSALTGYRQSGPVFEITKKIIDENIQVVELFGPEFGYVKNYTRCDNVADFFVNYINRRILSDAYEYNLCSHRAYSPLDIFNKICSFLVYRKPCIFNYKTYLGDDSIQANSDLDSEIFDWKPNEPTIYNNLREDAIIYGAECALSMLGQEKKRMD